MSPRFFTPPLLLRKSDCELVRLLRDGHEAAFSAIVLRHRPYLIRYCRRILRDHRAEDAVQQTFVRALGALRSGQEVRELRPWLCRIARNVALDEIGARNWDHAELDDRWADPTRSNEIEHRARLREALGAVEALPARQRTALALSVSGDSTSSIATELGVTSMAARQLLHRARMSVRAAVQAISPPPVLWISRRLTALSERLPRAAGAPAGAAPLATKVVVAVVASASVAAPVAAIHHALSQAAPKPPRERAALVQIHAVPALSPSPAQAPAAPVEFRRPAPIAPSSAAPPRKPEQATAAGSPSPALSASGTPSAPAGDGSGPPSSASTAAVAANAGPSAPPDSGSGQPAPMSSASASAPTASPSSGAASPDASAASASSSSSAPSSSASSGAPATSG